jgi:ammonia channel protein AmtB
MGFIDIGGAGVVHIMGGIAGFIGTWLIGPRVGLFRKDKELEYLLDEELILEEKMLFITKENYLKENKESFQAFNDFLHNEHPELEKIVNRVTVKLVRREFE